MEQLLPPEIIEKILLRLPIRSLIRFRCVCKEWSRIISDHYFVRRHTISRRYLGITTAFCITVASGQSLPLLGPHHHHHAFPDPLLSFLSPRYSDDPYAFYIVSSCGGLLLCVSTHIWPREWYVCNPTTRQHRRLLSPPMGPKSICYLHLAFDPYLSAFYKVVSVEQAYDNQKGTIRFHVYCSERMEWRTLSSNGKTLHNKIDIYRSTFFQGSLFWLSKSNSYLLALDVNGEKLRLVAVPRGVRKFWGFDFTATNGCFNMIVSRYSFSDEYLSAKFAVWEMKSEDNWALLYHVDLDVLLHSVAEYRNKAKIPLAVYRGVGEGSNKGDVVLVFLIDLKKIIMYRLEDNTFEVIHENVPTCGVITFPYSPSIMPV